MPMREVIWKSAISEHVWAEMPPNPLTGDVGAGPWQGTFSRNISKSFSKFQVGNITFSFMQELTEKPLNFF